jgi:hypothetical protein
MHQRAMRFVAGCLANFLVPMLAIPQVNSDASSVQELRRQLDDLRTQIMTQTNQMNLLQTRIEEIERSKTSVGANPTTAASADQQAVLAPRGGAPYVSNATSSYVTFAQDPAAAPRLDNALVDSRFPGFFRLPGTSAFLKIGGYFKTDFIYDAKPAGDPERFIPSSFVTGQPGVNNATVSIRPSRMSLDFRVPSDSLGNIRFYVEGDLFGANSTSPRLRHLYTQVKNFLIGQTFSNFMDPDAGPDELDFQGPNGQVNIRNPQIRYSFALAEKTSMSFSVEKPSSDVAFKTPEFSAQPNAPSPDGTVKLRQEYSGGHIQLAALFRGIGAYLPNGKSDSAFGWGLSLAGSEKVVGEDTLVYQIAYGPGIQRYLNDTSGLGIDAAVVSTQQPWLRTLPTVGTYFGYQHFWIPRVRSSVIYGFVQVNNTAYEPGSTYHKSDYMAGNLIWNVFGSLNVGTEFLYGWIEKKDKSSVNASRFMFSAKYDLNFARKE